MDVRSADGVGDSARDPVGTVVCVAHGQERYVDNLEHTALNKPCEIGEKVGVLVRPAAVVQLYI